MIKLAILLTYLGICFVGLFLMAVRSGEYR